LPPPARRWSLASAKRLSARKSGETYSCDCGICLFWMARARQLYLQPENAKSLESLARGTISRRWTAARSLSIAGTTQLLSRKSHRCVCFVFALLVAWYVFLRRDMYLSGLICVSVEILVAALFVGAKSPHPELPGANFLVAVESMQSKSSKPSSNSLGSP
jgi:hypothetical protein